MESSSRPLKAQLRIQFHDRRSSYNTVMLWAVAFAFLLLIHAPYLKLPYFWDELGQYVPQALDLYNEGRWMPIHTLPTVHPPGVQALLALVWLVMRGPSVAAARVLMLAIAAFGVVGSFLLAIRLSRKAVGVPAFAALLLLLASPLFYTQSMMVQLDMPAMAFSVWALVYFLDGRLRASVIMTTLAIFMKETALLLPIVFGGWLLIRERNVRRAAFYLIPCVLFLPWIGVVWRATGHPLGTPYFTQYNAWYSMHPIRLVFALIRRAFYLFISEFRWIGTFALIWVWRKTDWLRTPEWLVAGIFALAHTLLVSFLGGAVLERYLCPVLPVLFAAFGIGWASLQGRWRIAVPGLALAGSLLSMVWYPPYSFPFENNLAMADFVAIHKLTADYLASEPEIKVVATAWPLTDALRHPELGYVDKPIQSIEIHDFRVSNLRIAQDQRVDALVVYSREWDPNLRSSKLTVLGRFLERYYDYAPQATAREIEAVLGLHSKLRWEHRGMWVEIYR